jgi:putative FmdB family regulatory protein
MATYEYVCKKCDDVIEIMHPINDSPQIFCATCSIPRQKKFGLGAIQFKGNGWGSSPS